MILDSSCFREAETGLQESVYRLYIIVLPNGHWKQSNYLIHLFPFLFEFFLFCVNKLIGSTYFDKFEIIICEREEHEMDVFAAFVCQPCSVEGKRKCYIGQELWKDEIIRVLTINKEYY